MTRFALTATVLASLLLVTGAEAGPKGNNGNSATLDCPPGLAKKDPPCVPPGQAKNRDTSNDSDDDRDDDTGDDLLDGHVGDIIYGPGDVLDGDYILLINPWIYRSDLNAVYVRYGDFLYLIDRNGAYVLDRIGPVSDWTWSWDDTDFANCPPGLAKKNPPCVPPGQAKKGVTARDLGYDDRFDPYGIGDRLPDGYVTIIDPRLFPPIDTAYYVRRGDMIYRIDSETGRVLDVIGALADLFR